MAESTRTDAMPARTCQRFSSTAAAPLRRALFALVLAALALPSFAAKDPPQASRMSAIWEGVYNRMTRQSDQWYEDGDFPKCIQNLRIMHQLFPSDYEAATNLGWMLENVHEWDEALAIYVGFRTENPQNADAAWPEANYYYMKKVFAKVPAILEPTLSLQPPPHPNNFRTLAHSYEKLGMLKDSLRVWEALVKLTPEDDAAKRNLDRVKSKIGAAG